MSAIVSYGSPSLGCSIEAVPGGGAKACYIVTFGILWLPLECCTEGVQMRKLIQLILFATPIFAQPWSTILPSSRAIDWSLAGLPSTLPDGETTPNPWTPPTRNTQCVTAQCNAVSGGNVTAATINAAISSAPSQSYILIPAGTFALGGNINISASNVTLRGSGASQTTLTGGSINVGGGYVGGATLLTANPAKGATSVTVQNPPPVGRLAALEQCDDGFSASSTAFTSYGSGVNCTGAYSDPHGPWVCGLSSVCDRDGTGGGNSNPHEQAHVLWISGVSGNTVTFSSPLENGNWSTARTATLIWWNSPGTVGVGIEDLTIVGSTNFNGTYATWLKGCRIITTSGSRIVYHTFDTHSLVANNYIASTQGGSGSEIENWSSNSGEKAQSDLLYLNNIIEGGFVFGGGSEVGDVYAYNYFVTAQSPFVENGHAQHSAGTSFLLSEGNQEGMSQDDETWGTHNFNTWFRSYASCSDPFYPSATLSGLELGGWARFENLIGSVFGGGACSSSYATTISINARGLDTTGLTQASLLQWGNYAICSDGNSHCNTVSFDISQVPSNLSSFGANSTPYQVSVPTTQTLPASFFMPNMTAHPNGGTGLSWWSACTSWSSFPTTCAGYSTAPMPAMGPDVTGGPLGAGHVNNIPAALVWANLPADSNYPVAWGVGHLRQFDERAYQTDSASSSGTPVSACDLNQDGVVNSSDYSLAVNMTLGLSACTANIVAPDVCNVVVVQRVANASLGLACVTGP